MCSGRCPEPHLAIVEIADDTVGGYTAPGMVALASRAFTNPVNYRLLAQEISHLWWRCLVSPATPDDAFLDEGLAEYSKAMYVQEAAGDAAFEDLMRDTAVGALTHEEVAPIAQAGQLHEFTPEYQSIVFDKGAMVFHMLRWVIGDDAFRKTLRAMAQQYAWKSITTDQFQRLAEKASKQELTFFFAQWVNSTGVPQFKRNWAVYRLPKGLSGGGQDAAGPGYLPHAGGGSGDVPGLQTRHPAHRHGRNHGGLYHRHPHQALARPGGPGQPHLEIR